MEGKGNRLGEERKKQYDSKNVLSVKCQRRRQIDRRELRNHLCILSNEINVFNILRKYYNDATKL